MDEVKPYVMKTPRLRPEKPDVPQNDSESGPQTPRPSEYMLSRQRLSEVLYCLLFFVWKIIDIYMKYMILFSLITLNISFSD